VAELLGSGLAKFFDSLANAEHVPGQMQMAAGFEDGDQPVKIRARMRAGDDDADGMEKFFALRSGFRFHFVDDLFELLRSQVARAR